MGLVKAALLFICLLGPVWAEDMVISQELPGPEKQSWGYLQVRPGANMFYWLQFAGGSQNYTSYPLLIWLQGGPGASSSGVGNFEEIGPVNVKLENRNYTWLRKANLMFLDSPVGTGYSYVNQTSNNHTLYPTNMTQMVADLLAFTSSFLQKLPEFQKVPIHIVGESYGGKVAANFALALSKACKSGQIGCTLKSVTLGDPWISPLDHIKSWGQLLEQMAYVDSRGRAVIEVQAQKVETLVLAGMYSQAMDQFYKTLYVIHNMTNGVSLYNLLYTDTPLNIHSSTSDFAKFFLHYGLQNFSSPELYALMNGKIKEQLGTIPTNVTWGGQAAEVFKALRADHLKSAIETVDLILNTTDLKLTIYTSQLDLVCNVAGTMTWIKRLNWVDYAKFKNAQRNPFYLLDHPTSTAGFVQKYGKLSLYWVLRAGHLTPKDHPEAAFTILSQIF